MSEMSEEFLEMLTRLDLQSREFDKLRLLATAFGNLPAVVDDDYPKMRQLYEAALSNFIVALRNNGRLTSFLPLPSASAHLPAESSPPPLHHPPR